jgi:hypothetical protein
LTVDGTHTVYEDLELCSTDRDIYAVEVPPYSWLSFSIEIDGSGAGATDIDLYEVAHDDHPVDEDISWIGDSGGYTLLNYSAKSTDYERLAWYNPTSRTKTHHLLVLPYDGASTDYDIRIRTSDWHESRDCDDIYDDSDEDGPCNRIMQFPNAVSGDQGYLVTHEQHYSNQRREVAYLVQWATALVEAEFPGTNPLALLDMGQADGDTPGRLDDSLRHPEGTHINGNDMDLAYYQTGDDNMGRAVCDNDGYNCTGEAYLLDAERTAYFMAMLMRSPYVRVIGVDTEVAEDVLVAADELRRDGLINGTDVSNLETYMAYSTDGWPFHHHHMHFSWQWEDGHSGMDMLDWDGPVGCEFSLDSIRPSKGLPEL